MRSDHDIYVELLVLRAQDGDRQAFAALVDYFHPRLLRHARHLTRDVEAAADVVQEAWLVVARSLRRLDDPACFGTWVYRIVGNKSHDWLRRRVRGRETTQSLQADPPVEDYARGEHDGEIARVRAALTQLSRDQRAVLSMYYLDDMSVREIADALSLPLGTVKSRLFYGRNRLKQVLEGGDR